VVALERWDISAGYPQFQSGRRKEARRGSEKMPKRKGLRSDVRHSRQWFQRVVSLDVTNRTIPEGKVNGWCVGEPIWGSPITFASTRLVPAASAAIWFKGNDFSRSRNPDLLHPKGGRNARRAHWTVFAGDKTPQPALPQSANGGSPNPSQPSECKTYNNGYAMKLEPGQTRMDSTLPGKIFFIGLDMTASKPSQRASSEAAVSTHVWPQPLAPTRRRRRNPNARYAKPPPNAARTPVEQRYGVHVVGC